MQNYMGIHLSNKEGFTLLGGLLKDMPGLLKALRANLLKR